MGAMSPYSTPEYTPLRPEIVDASTPWSDVLLEDYTTIRSESLQPYTDLLRSTLKSSLRHWNRPLWLAVLLIAGIWWSFGGRIYLPSLPENAEMLNLQFNVEGLQFIDATHPYIRYVGRWLSISDGEHKDGSFPGVYFDFAVNGSATVLLSLYNRELQPQTPTKQSANTSPILSFLPIANASNAAPISLLARVDDDEYIVLPNATSIVTIRRGNLDIYSRHEIRIIAPMVGHNATETLQVEGLWIEEGGQLLPFEGSPDYESERLKADQEGSQPVSSELMQKRMLEIVTDLPGSMAWRDRGKNSSTARGILGGVMGWEYLLGEMFGADHVTIGMDGMCLIQDCIGGRGSPAGLADVFFQSGPAGSEQYAHAWLFQDYTPDVMVLNVGNSDWESFQSHYQEYNKSLWEMSVVFEETYISMIKAIRTLAYPKYSSTSLAVSRYTYTTRNAAAGIPIFIMRPFRGQLEAATHSVVNRLQKEGDKAIFWLDTSGWLNTEVDFDDQAEDQDFFLDEESPSKEWRLTERGNQRVAILLHMHVCRYLAAGDADKCAFLPPEIYQGKAIDHEAIHFDEFLEDERERKLKKLFWK